MIICYIYYSWDMACDRCNCYFSFWAIFCPFTPLTAQKIKILKKWKKHLEISSFYTSVPKIMIICYTVPEIWHVTDVIVIFHFGLFFALLQPKKSKFQENGKKRLEMSSFYTCAPKLIIRWCTVPKMWHRMDGWKKWHIEVGAPPKNVTLMNESYLRWTKNVVGKQKFELIWKIIHLYTSNRFIELL